MKLKFLDRENERSRLTKAFAGGEGSLCCLYGRRRCGKSRLLQEVLPAGRSVYHAADEREPSLQRGALAVSIERLVPGFAEVSYPDWSSLLERWFRDAPAGSVLALDEFPYLVAGSRELPSIVQRLVDEHSGSPVHLAIAGSSQRMMQGIVLDASAPLYGRAREILEIRPLGAAWLREAFGFDDAIDAIEAWSVWGGIPRYWELALDHASTREAVRELVLDPRGVLHSEPRRLLLEDLRETAQAASILSLIGAGCGRISEIAARLEKPSTSLTRPLSRLIDMGLVRRELPFGAPERSGKRSVYRIRDPFLSFWFRFVEPVRSRLEAGDIETVSAGIDDTIDVHRGRIWEDLARDAVPLLTIDHARWGTARRWWGPGADRKPMEIDIAAESVDGRSLLLGEARLSADGPAREGILRGLEEKASRLPAAAGYDRIVARLFVAKPDGPRDSATISADEVVTALR